MKNERAIDAFERAVEDKVFEGQVPWLSNYREEQLALDLEHKRIATNYTRSRNKLLKLLENNNG